MNRSRERAKRYASAIEDRCLRLRASHGVRTHDWESPPTYLLTLSSQRHLRLGELDSCPILFLFVLIIIATPLTLLGHHERNVVTYEWCAVVRWSVESQHKPNDAPAMDHHLGLGTNHVRKYRDICVLSTRTRFWKVIFKMYRDMSRKGYRCIVTCHERATALLFQSGVSPNYCVAILCRSRLTVD